MSDSLKELGVKMRHVEKRMLHAEVKLDSQGQLKYQTNANTDSVDDLENRMKKVENAILEIKTYGKIWGVVGPMIGSGFVALIIHLMEI